MKVNSYKLSALITAFAISGFYLLGPELLSNSAAQISVLALLIIYCATYRVEYISSIVIKYFLFSAFSVGLMVIDVNENILNSVLGWLLLSLLILTCTLFGFNATTKKLKFLYLMAAAFIGISLTRLATILYNLEIERAGSYLAYSAYAFMLMFIALALLEVKNSTFTVIMSVLGVVVLFIGARTFGMAIAYLVIIQMLEYCVKDVHRNTMYRWLMGVAVSIACLLPFYLPDIISILQRLASIESLIGTQDIYVFTKSPDNRSNIWNELIPIAFENMYFGVGASSGSWMYAQELSAHNILVEILYRKGLFGVGLYFIILLSIYRILLAALDVSRVRRAAQLILVCFFIDSFGVYTLFSTLKWVEYLYWGYLSYCTGLALQQIHIRRRKLKEKMAF